MLTTVSGIFAVAGAFGTVFLWGLFGPNGLVAAVVYFDAALFLVVLGSRKSH